MNRLRRHRLTGVLYLATGCLALPANAQVVQEYEYEPNRIYQVRTGLGITTQIELSPNEEVIDYSTGFSSGWDLTRRDNVFYLKPKNVDVDTNMMICIDRPTMASSSSTRRRWASAPNRNTGTPPVPWLLKPE